MIPEAGIWFHTAALIARIGGLLIAARLVLAVLLGYVANGKSFVGSTVLGLGMSGALSDDRAF